MVTLLLRNVNTEVIVCLIENMDLIVAKCSAQSVEEKFLTNYLSLMTHKTWRVRLAAT